MPRKLKIAYFVHSVRSDWNNGNAHFLRGLMRTLGQMGHQVTCFEPERSWSFDNLLTEPTGHQSLDFFASAYPDLCVRTYPSDFKDLREALRESDIVIVHEWNEPALAEHLLRLRDELHFKALFHDTHHRASSSPEQIAQLHIHEFDGVLAFGQALHAIYANRFHIDHVWTFHEAADTSVFFPREMQRTTDVVWIGNWGDNERTKEIREFLICPAACLRDLRFAVYGVRYPQQGRNQLEEAGIQFRGYLPNVSAPDIYCSAAATVHIPRQQYTEAMTGIPTIRVFEALACGIPLISAPWEDSEQLFKPGDFAWVRDTDDTIEAMECFVRSPESAREQAEKGLETILDRHTCRHRAEQLTGICEEILSA